MKGLLTMALAREVDAVVLSFGGGGTLAVAAYAAHKSRAPPPAFVVTTCGDVDGGPQSHWVVHSTVEGKLTIS